MPTLTDTLPDIDLSKVEIPKVELPRLDIPDAVAEAMTAAGLRKSSPSRWPLAVAGVVVASLAGWAVLNSEAIRTRLIEVVDSIRQRITAMQSISSDVEPIAFPAAETMPIEPGHEAEYETPEAADYPAGLGSVTSSRS